MSQTNGIHQIMYIWEKNLTKTVSFNANNSIPIAIIILLLFSSKND